MKNAITFLCVIAMSVSVFTQTSTPPVGTGTSGDPYLIATLDNLHWITQNPGDWDKYYKQTASIDASVTSTWNGGLGFAPIADHTSPFMGKYDGNNFVISNLYINRPSASSGVGLFGATNTGAEIKNLGVTNVNIIGNNAVGGLVGDHRHGVVSESYSSGSVGGVENVGGLVGYIYGTGSVSKSYSTANVNGSALIGGLVGYLDGGTVINSYSKGNINGSGLLYAGGLIGAAYQGTITNSYSTGSVGSGSDVGGLTGGAWSSTVTNSFWDTQTSQQSISAGGVGKTTNEMKTNSTYLAAGWSPSTWFLDTGVNDGYPYLYWQNPSGTALPVELTSFSASVIGSNVKLSWKTATEINNYGFEVERKILKQVQNDNWEKIGFVNGNGNSNSPKSYTFVDDKISTGNYSYRLKQIDNDGQYEYSKTIEVDVNGVKEYRLTQNYPNPFNPATTIQYILPQAGMVRLTLYNILGQEIRTLVNEMKEAGTHTININASDLDSGMYIYKIESGSFVQTRKMTLVK